MYFSNEHKINGYIFSIKNIITIKRLYRGMILFYYRSDIKMYCDPPSVIYTPGAFKSPNEAEIEALAYAGDLIRCESLATILDD